MRAFAANGYMLRYARLEIRLIYSAFLLFVLIGMATTAAFQIGHIGLSPSSIAAHYLGGEVGDEMTFAKTFRQLVEGTHFHAFIMGVIYLVLAHLFVATALDARWKRFFIIVGMVGLAADLILPWLIRYASGTFSYGLLLAWLAEWTGFAAYIFVPLGEMWLPSPRREFPPE